MFKKITPPFCIPCIERLQAQCPHLQSSFCGGYHLTGGDVWDDITEFCDDCGANLDELHCMEEPFSEGEIFPKEEPPCET